MPVSEKFSDRFVDIGGPNQESRSPSWVPRLLLGHRFRFSCWSRAEEVDKPKSRLGKDAPLGSCLGGVPIPCKDLQSALQTFERCGVTAVKVATAGNGVKSHVQLWASACELVRALLLGVGTHLPDLQPEIDLREHSPDAPGVESVSLALNFGSRVVVGEVATPSRCCFEVRLSGIVRFALERPSPSAGDSQLKLTLRVHGVDLPALQDGIELRKRLQVELGSEAGGFCKQEVFDWWMQHKDTAYPLETSKFHRLYESLFGQRGMQLLPKTINHDSLWGFLHNPGCTIQSFTFHSDSRDRTTLTAERSPAKSDEEAELLKTCRQVAQDILKDNRAAGERFAASATNFAALLYGHEIGQAGAKAAVIVKLFSAAKWWGPGTDGWGRFDQTWGCKDKRNAFGVVVEEQGRILWRLESKDDCRRKTEAARLAGKSCASVASKVPNRHGLLCCRRRSAQDALLAG
mmetsp:Transcript_27385/g.78321  ORF Transcript_27385/g.78321 Transcript_27385/m.78321 type:complete len:461 (-) Transcript_27385:90-1472(-)